MQIITWLVAAMFAFAPARESERARYTEIASDLAAVTFDESEAPLFAGESGRAQTAIVLASIAAHESTFRKDVEEGRARGDSGKSWCFMQLNLGHRTTVEGWTGEQLAADRKLCFRAGLHVARESFRMCSGFPIAEKLGAYASGSCGKSAESRQMVTRAVAFMKRHPASDSEYFFIEKNTPWMTGATAENND